MRLFVALDLETSVRERIALFLRGVEGFAPEVRWAKPESLHITLKFIGEQSVENLPRIQQALTAIASATIRLTFRGYGFFPSNTAPRVFWVGIESSPALPALAAEVDSVLSPLDIPPETHAFTPHLTLARSASGTPRKRKEDQPNLRFAELQKRLTAMPALDFGTMTAHEFFLYESKLSPQGSQYRKICNFALRRT